MHVPKIIASLIAASLLAIPASGSAASATAPAKIPTKYSSCTAVKKVSSGGIAKTAKDARRVKGKQKVNAKVYRKYKKWDRNGDGVICGPNEKKFRRNGGGGNEHFNGRDRCPSGYTFSRVTNISVPDGWFILKQGERYNGYEVIIQNMYDGRKKDASFTLVCHKD